LFRPKQRVWIGVITDSEGPWVYVAHSQTHLEKVMMDNYHHGMTSKESPSFDAFVKDLAYASDTKVMTDCYYVERPGD
jgi:hypothetical protein